MPTPLDTYVRLQTALDTDILRALGVTASSVESELRRLQSRVGIGAEVRSYQLTGTKAALDRELARYWERVGDTTAAAQLNAAATAAEETFLSSGLLDGMVPAEDRDYMVRSVRAGAERGLETAMERVSGTSYIPLAQSVYDNAALSSGKIDDIVTAALARGASAKELADDVRDFVNPNTPGGVRYASMRLARSELNNAFHASQIRQAQSQPWTLSVDWNLSGSHPVPDECNVYAEQVHFEGGEPGQFRPSEVPAKPHPNCLCFTTTTDIGPEEFLRRLQNGEFDDPINQTFPDLETKPPAWGGEEAFVDPEGGVALRERLDSIAPTPPRPPQPWKQDTWDFTVAQRAGDPNVGMIADRGVQMDGSNSLRNHGVDGHCHWNTSKLFEAGEVDEIVIGYVHNAEVGWIQHTWGRKGGRVVETNVSVRADTYFGVPLSPEEAVSFAKWCKDNQPGMGRVRRASDA